jgi:N-acetyl-1-D-myo-inositol-2-amino-2-deoxy-alpha-D-glucopyranoside deacetylase
MSEAPVLLVVLAHPDDESFGTGGTLALYAQRGVQVHLVCATRGEAGEVAEEFLEGFDSIADRRVSELRCAAGILGLSGVHFLDYRDSGMAGSPDNSHPNALAAAPVDEVAAKIAHFMRSLRPQVVITFDPIGGYKHPDHIAVHRATVRAFEMASDPAYQDQLPTYQPQKLYYHVFPKRMFRLIVRLLPLLGRDPRRFGRNGDIDLLALVEEGDFPVHASIDYRSVIDKRDGAAACHVSQLGGGPPRRGLIGWAWRRMGGKDQYTRAYPPPTKGLREDDLFA